MIAPGTIGMCATADSVVSRVISWRQNVPYSHAIIHLGNGLVADSTWRWTRIEDESYWLDQDREIDWFEPVESFTEEQVRVLRSAAYFADDRMHYGIGMLLNFVIRGHNPGRGHTMYCSYFVGELYLTAADRDLHGLEMPWDLDMRGLLTALEGPGFRQIDPLLKKGE